MPQKHECRSAGRMIVYYNCTKKHSGIDGRIPAEAAIIQADGRNKGKTPIQHAFLNAIKE